MLTLATQVLAAMDQLPWFRSLNSDERSQVGLVLESGLGSFATWLEHPDEDVPVSQMGFAAAPRELTRAITLQQTVQLIRMTMVILEDFVPRLAAPGDEDALRELVLRYSRELGFSAAEVYARAAEARGAWDARIEAGVVDALIRGSVDRAALSRALSLGWKPGDWVLTLAAASSDGPDGFDFTPIHARARLRSLSILAGEASGAVLVVVGGSSVREQAIEQLVEVMPSGAVVIGPVVDGLDQAADSVQEALSGLRALPAWLQAPRPVWSAELLAERTVLGDVAAARRLVEEIYNPLLTAAGDLIATVSAFLDGGRSVEGTGRALFLHPNTVRYRLKKVTELIGYDLNSPHEALTVQLALVLGRIGTRAESIVGTPQI